MKGSTLQPKAFISYSWTTPEHERWVLELAERLSGDGIVVILDKWDLKEGQDKHVFMEQMVHDPTVDKVLVVCDRGYQIKADDRKGGVGTETQIISKEVYENTGQEKFIPIVREFSEGSPCTPHFMAARIYIDLSSDEVFEQNYQKLVRNLYGKPLLKRPPVGTPPGYIADDEPTVLRTSRRIGALKDALLNDRRSTNGFIEDFLTTFLASLEDFRLTGGTIPGFDDKVVESIEKMLPLRNDFIEFALLLFKYKDVVDLEQMHRFWETLIRFTFRPESVQSWTEIDYDNYRFFNYELMLSFIGLLLQLGKYKEAGYFIHAPYFYRNDTSELKQGSIAMFNRHVRSLDEYRNNRLSLHRVSVTADLIKARATLKEVPFEGIRQADLLLHYVTELERSWIGWFPRTSTFGQHGSGVDLFERLVSRNHFERVKPLFDVNTVDGLKTRVQEYVARSANRQNYGRTWDYDIRPIEKVFDLSNLATTR